MTSERLISYNKSIKINSLTDTKVNILLTFVALKNKTVGRTKSFYINC